MKKIIKNIFSVRFIYSILLLITISYIQAEIETCSSFEKVTQYIIQNQKLPDYYITKKEAKELGWIPGKTNLWEITDHKCIGGDIFQNREKKLPKKKGRVWIEADVGFEGKKRNANRILFSSDGLIFKTIDHYSTFEKLYP